MLVYGGIKFFLQMNHSRKKLSKNYRTFVVRTQERLIVFGSAQTDPFREYYVNQCKRGISQGRTDAVNEHEHLFMFESEKKIRTFKPVCRHDDNKQENYHTEETLAQEAMRMLKESRAVK